MATKTKRSATPTTKKVTKVAEPPKSLQQHREEARLYVKGCTDRQLEGVIEAEVARIKRFLGGPTADVARILLDEARSEQYRRLSR